ncbi:glycosyltransferase family 2 protein [Facklamia sp. P12955]|uniref:glycosyltransferase family 2 protein n=1 Tax=Facklamia sp. P12955 TaxID=3421946 RepID=UPI003D1873A5
MNHKLISIVIPVYNVENYLEKCVKSVLNQTYNKLEIILVNDGSTDRSKEICDELASSDKRIKIINKENGGLSDARNVGISNSTGEYIGFVDSDDWIEHNMYETLLDSIENNNTEIAICGIYREYKNETKVEDNDNKILTSKQALKKLLIGDEIHDHAWSKLYRRSLFKNVRYPKGKVYEDIRTTYKLFLNSNKVSLANQPLYHYRQRKGSIIRNGFSETKFEWLYAIQELLNEPYLREFEDHIEYRLLKTKLMLIRELFIYSDNLTFNKYNSFLKSTLKDIKTNQKLLLNDKKLPNSLKLITFLSNKPISVIRFIFTLISLRNRTTFKYYE